MWLGFYFVYAATVQQQIPQHITWTEAAVPPLINKFLIT